ncbi:MAG: hypothetical protein LM566_05600 [Pyrobaculum sp.]|nr:hypothetical protein [Pyrobaculum sp.]
MECDVVVEYLKERGLEARRVRLDFLTISVGSLKLGLWCPKEEFPEFNDVEDVNKTLELDSLDVLIIVSYRPYVLVDYINSFLERAHRWYGLKFDVKLLGVSTVELETSLEDALGRAFVERPQKLGPGIETEYNCPQCGKGVLRLYRQDRFFSRKYRGRVVENIYACPLCNFRVRSLSLLD